ncbi:MAG: hypothetical protein ACREQ9_04365 [Candidatus Binatia bacterium]
MSGPFESFYRSDLQALYAPWIAPVLFLLWLVFRESPREDGAEPAAARFVRAWAIAFALETLLDPLVTGPLLSRFGAEEWAAAVLLPFVLLGDFRVFLLVLFVAEPGLGLAVAAGRAALWTLVMPLVAGATHGFLDWSSGGLPGQSLWLVYETAFLLLAVAFALAWVPAHVAPDRRGARRYLRALLAYVAVYYFLWATADALILAGLDLGWALRAVPNQLYYALWVPFAYALFFRIRVIPAKHVPA